MLGAGATRTAARKAARTVVGTMVGALALMGAVAACVTETSVKELCEEDGSALCVSETDCPIEPPSAGRDCQLATNNGMCFYCSEGKRVEASNYQCVGGQWARNANVDCTTP